MRVEGKAQVSGHVALPRYPPTDPQLETQAAAVLLPLLPSLPLTSTAAASSEVQSWSSGEAQ